MRLIDADALMDKLHDWRDRILSVPGESNYKAGILDQLGHDKAEIEDAPAVDGLIRCKDCKHCGVKNGATPFDIVWPDGVCPCRSDDPYYSWIPDGDWYCADGERREVG